MYDLAALELAGEGGLGDTIFAGKLHFSPVTGSTNNDALKAARNGAPHGSVYFADEQTAGRGRGDHGWHSTAGEGLYASVVLRPPIPAARLPLLPLAVGLAAAEAIQRVSGLKTDLRWPNDVLIGERKTCGILVEALSERDAVQFAVAGIGINVHQRSFAPDLSLAATSLDIEAGTGISRQALLVALLKSLEHETLAPTEADAARAIPARVESASTWVSGRKVEVHGPQACAGITCGLDEHGFLKVRTNTGLITVQTGGIRAARDD